jgi:Cu/Ag efflux pump CusA
VDDIENVVLAQSNGVPVLIKDVANVKVGYVPRLGICGRDHEDDVVASIVVMSRVEANRPHAAQGQGRPCQNQYGWKPAAGSQSGSVL